MEPVLYEWADTVMNTIEIAALGAILWQLTHLRREITALVRVVRRMDRKSPDSTISGHRRQAELNEPRMQVSAVSAETYTRDNSTRAG
jgi:hypothetical protein